MSEHPVVACYRGLDNADAVQLGALLARTLGESLVLAHAYRYEPISLSARAEPSPVNSRRVAAAQTALRRARRFARRDVEVHDRIVASADVGAALTALAREESASVLVLGRDTDGHVTRSLVPRAPCPVAVAPVSVPLPSITNLGRLGVAYDGSASARCALIVGSRLALLTGARLDVLAAGPTAEHANAWLHIARLAIRHEAPFETRTLVGDPRAALSAASADLDLLVCGSRGRGRAAAAILGSVSLHLTNHAECPILVVPPGVEQRPSWPLGVTTAA